MNEKVPNIKELFFEADTRKHQQLVAERMIACAKRIMDKAMAHDASKFSEVEKSAYVGPVWELNTRKVEYGSEEYHLLTKQMGVGLAHHYANNDHHIEFFRQFEVQTLNDPVRAMDLFALMEMLCDWIAAAKRKNNDPALAFKQLEKYIPSDSQLGTVLRNTLSMIEEFK